MKLRSLTKDYKLFTHITVFGAIIVASITLYFSYKQFCKDAKREVKNFSNTLNQQITESFSYVENISNLIATQIVESNYNSKKNIAAILLATRPKIDENIHNLFTWTLFDFVDPNGYAVASSVHGLLKKPLLITKEERSWISEAKIHPWKLLNSKIDVGIVSRELIIPLGFGITRKNENNKFIGTISVGISVAKLKSRLESSFRHPYITFALFDQNQSAILTSSNINLDKEKFYNYSKQLTEITNNKSKSGFVSLGKNEYFYQKHDSYPFLILTGINRDIFLSTLRSEFTPRLLNIFYLVTFFLILLYFFRTKLINPISELYECAKKISQEEVNIKIPSSEIKEIDLLADSMEMVRQFVEKQKEERKILASEKDLASRANQNKAEFFYSVTHELKNIITGIVGLTEVVKNNFTDHKQNKSFSDSEFTENQYCLENILELSSELSHLIFDIMEINQAQSGDFEVRETSEVDIEEIVNNSVKLLRNQAIKNKKHIESVFIKQKDQNFIVTNLDPQRIKQIIANLLTNAIRHAEVNSKVEIRVEQFGEEASEALRETIINNNKELSQRKNYLLNIVKKPRPKVIISIKERGKGISKQCIEKAMSKYVPINDSRLIDPTELDLSLIRQLIELQGGMMMISSKENIGTEIKIIF